MSNPTVKYNGVPDLIVTYACSGTLCDEELDFEVGGGYAIGCPVCGTKWSGDAEGLCDGQDGVAFDPTWDGDYADDAREFDL